MAVKVTVNSVSPNRVSINNQQRTTIRSVGLANPESKLENLSDVDASDPDNNQGTGASWSYTQGPLGTWTQNGPGFVGTGNAGNNQYCDAISGDGKVAAVIDDAGEFWTFV